MELGWNRRYQCKLTISKMNSSLSPKMATTNIPLPVHAHQTSRERGGYLFFFTGLNLGTPVPPDPRRRCRRRHWASSRVCLLEVGSFSFFLSLLSRLCSERSHGAMEAQASFRDPWETPADILAELSAASQHQLPALAASPVREPSWTSFQSDL